MDAKNAICGRDYQTREADQATTMKIKVNRSCPICNGKNIDNIKRISFNMENILPDFYYLAACKQCGFVYANTSATADDYEKYYSTHNKYSDSLTIDNEADSIYQTISSLLNKHVRKDDAVLDMGCGTGGLLINMKRNGYSNLTGCDPSQRSVNKLKEKGLFCIKRSIYDIYEKKLRKFDVILLSGVLEHLYDLNKAIRNISSYLNQNGKIICFVPDVLNYNTYPAPLSYYVNIEHINHFCHSTFNRLFELHGFSMLECISETISFGAINAPVLLGVFENENSNSISCNKISRYFQNIILKEKENVQIINAVVCSRKKLAIWGTGNLARSYMKNSNLREANITCFIDNNTEIIGREFCGYKINLPEYLRNFEGTILILSILYYKSIKMQIQGMGLTNSIITLQV
jgi:SAM-dependent methyltransferase